MEVNFMQTHKLDFTAQGVLSLFAIAALVGYAAHSIEASPPKSMELYALAAQQAPADPNISKSAVFTGTIAKDDSDFILRDPSGAIYHLDDPSKAQPFEGKSVKIVGKLEATSKLIHVENIKEINA
jgi:hypothetical protein